MGTTFRIESAIIGALTLVLAVGFGSSSPRADDVKMFQSAPSVDELERALGTGKSKPRTRSIQIDGAEPPSAAPQPSYAAPQYTQPAAVAAAPQSQYAAPSAVQAQGKAVGFPINFGSNSTALRPDSMAFLQSIAGLMQRNPSLHLLIEGHTDAKGNFQHNMELSRGRADTVMSYLVTQFGVSSARLDVVGKGPTEPLNDGNPFAPANRRVQFRVTG